MESLVQDFPDLELFRRSLGTSRSAEQEQRTSGDGHTSEEGEEGDRLPVDLAPVAGWHGVGQVGYEMPQEMFDWSSEI